MGEKVEFRFFVGDMVIDKLGHRGVIIDLAFNGHFRMAYVDFGGESAAWKKESYLTYYTKPK